jgi:AspT/YidE/YbjL antiporter-like protein
MIGRIPTPTLWIFESLGLTGFVAVVGLAAGPDFVRGLQTSGISLIVAGIVTALVPHLVGILIGHRIFKMHPGILLGVCAGAGTATPALAAIQEAARSDCSNPWLWRLLRRRQCTSGTVGYSYRGAVGLTRHQSSIGQIGQLAAFRLVKCVANQLATG